MLTYGPEVWGIMADYSITERVHMFAIKRCFFLNVSTRTPSALVSGEIGRYPLYVNTYTRCIKYWLNLVRMPDNRLLPNHTKCFMTYIVRTRITGGLCLFYIVSIRLQIRLEIRESVTRKDFCASLDSD